MQFDSKDIESLDKIYRLNLINSISGIKPATLVGTVSETGASNLAIFSSVFHLGSHPPLLGMICRPDAEVPRHTLANIKSKGSYTLNHLPHTLSQNGHYTSAKFDKDVSEFDKCGFTEAHLDFNVPFVEESPIKLGLDLKQIVPIEANGTVMIIGEVVKIIIDDKIINAEGQLDLEAAGSAGISGLNSYYSLTKLATYPYARVSELPHFGKEK